MAILKAKPASRQRAALQGLQAATEREVRAAFVPARAAATTALATFTRAYGAELKTVREDGDDDAKVSLLWLHTGGRLDTVHGPVTEAVRLAATHSFAATIYGQRQVVQTVRKAAESSGLALPPIADSAGRIGSSGYQGSLSSYFDQLPPQAWQRITDAINAGVANGQSASQMLSALLAILGSIGGWAILIAGTELTLLWRDILGSIFGVNSNTVAGWIWRAQPDACERICAPMNGTRHGVDETLDSHPNCLCEMEPYDVRDQLVEVNW